MEKPKNCSSICLDHGCSFCCNPVKIDARSPLFSQGVPEIFIELNQIAIPLEHIETVRLRIFQCVLYNSETGYCDDYQNRPPICRNTECLAFHIDDYVEQKNIIKYLLCEEFLWLKKK